MLDGRLLEPEWNQVKPEDNWMQYDPSAGAAPTEKTEVRILYNDEFMFVGIRAFDAEPHKIIRSGLERDYDIEQDDGIAFVLDTYNDKATGLIFATNTLGARWDAEISADGNNENSSYNTFWDAAALIDSLGYSIEMRIPFSSLRFESKEKILMGFRLVRLIKRKNEYLIFPPCDPKVEDAYFKVSLAREMILSGLKSRKPFYLVPYLIANFSEEYVLNPEGDAYIRNKEFMQRKNFSENETIDKIISNAGMDVKYGLSKNFTLDFTINTDFAQAEVDNRIINLTKYEVNLPEKRSFFLESRNHLSFSTSNGTQLFISRSIGREKNEIVPILSGVRITGKSQGWQMGILDMQTKGVSASEIEPHNFFVFRTRKDIDSTGSFVGGIITNRLHTGANNGSDQSIGIDFVKKINTHLTYAGAFANSSIDLKYPDFANQSFYNLAVFRSAKEGTYYNAGVNAAGKYFQPKMGFADEMDYSEANAGMGYNLKSGENSKASYFFAGTSGRYRWKLSSGNRETIYGEAYAGINFKSGAEIFFSLIEYAVDSLFEDWELNDKNAISAGTYTSFRNTLELTAPQKSVYSADIALSYGSFYGGKRLFASPEVTYRFSRHFNAAINYEYNHITFKKYFDESRNTIFKSHLVRTGISCLFSSAFSIKLFAQYDNQSRQLESNIRIRFNPSEGTDLFIVFNQAMNSGRSRMVPRLPLISNQAITVKFIKTFAM